MTHLESYYPSYLVLYEMFVHYRAALNLSQREFAARVAGLSVGDYARYERGEFSFMRADTLRDIADAFGHPVGTLIVSEKMLRELNRAQLHRLRERINAQLEQQQENEE